MAGSPVPWRIDPRHNPYRVIDKNDDIVLYAASANSDQRQLVDLRMASAAPDLLSALVDVMDLIEKQMLVRNTNDDAKSNWTTGAMQVVLRLKNADDAIKKAQGLSE